MKWKEERPKVTNMLWAYIWDKRLEISKYILMKAHKSKMRAVL